MNAAKQSPAGSPKLLTIGFAPRVDGGDRAVPIDLTFLVRADGRVFLDKDAWIFVHTLGLDLRPTAILALGQAATRAAHGAPARIVGVVFVDGDARVEVAGALQKARGTVDFLTATLFVGGVEREVEIAPVPFTGARFEADIADIAERLALKLLAEWHAFAGGPSRAAAQ